MATGLLHLHSLLRWIILVFLIVSIVKAYTGWQSKKEFAPADKKTWLFTMIAGHITLLLGLYQVLAGRIGIFTTELAAGTSVMKNKFYRFYWVEHPVTMITAIVFLTLAHGVTKKNVDSTTKYKKAFYFFVVALVLILAGVPWPFRDIDPTPRTWFPGM